MSIILIAADFPRSLELLMHLQVAHGFYLRSARYVCGREKRTSVKEQTECYDLENILMKSLNLA